MYPLANIQNQTCGVLIENCLLKDSRGSKDRTAFVGQMVKIMGSLDNGEVSIKILKDGETWERFQFICKRNQIAPVEEKLLFYLSSIPPQERVKLAKNREKCEKLSNLTKDMTVAVSFNDDVVLGVIKYIGLVKGIGRCIGVQLHEKRDQNKCDGTCAGLSYFSCTPGKGVFVTIEKINPINVTTSKEPQKKSDLDVCLEKSISNLFLREKELDTPPKYEEIITKYGEYTNMSNKNTTYIRNSLSLQNMLEVDKSTNSNNDFDNNSMMPPDKTYLIHESDSKKKLRNKSELDLIDIIGNSSYDNREKNGEYSGSSRKLNGSKIDGEVTKFGKKRISTPVAQSLENGTSSTLRKRIGTELRITGGSKSSRKNTTIDNISYDDSHPATELTKGCSVLQQYGSDRVQTWNSALELGSEGSSKISAMPDE